MGSFFSVKTKTPDCVNANLVYEFTCHGCGSRYAGETLRHLQTRAAEHGWDSYQSNIKEHNKICKRRKVRRAQLNEFKILMRNFDSNLERKIAEKLFIRKLRPELNCQGSDNCLGNKIILKIFC